MVVPVRTLVAWCPDWPVVATGAPLDEPVAVIHANRIVASSPSAREHGVVRGLRRRVAQARCADLQLHERDEAREARTFEPVIGTLDNITPRIEIIRPGTCAVTTLGPSRYFGGDEKVADLIREAMGTVLNGRTEVRIGIADGSFAAELAARAAQPTRLIAQGEVAEFLAPMRVAVLEQPELADVLVRLGIGTLGAFAALPATDVLARFGSEGLAAHRLASGLDERPPDARHPPVDWSASAEIDPPALQVDRVAFVARSLADEFHQRLGRAGVTCVRVAIEAETEFGEEFVRLWRHEGTLSDAAVADRVRWQLDGWLNGPAATRPSGGISRVSLMPDELIAAKGRQLGFWGGETEVDERAARVAARLQGQLGADAVRVVERRGGRHFGERLMLVPAATVELRGRTLFDDSEQPPWPGGLPTPSPTRVVAAPRAVEVVDEAGEPVQVDGRGLLSAPPVELRNNHTRAEVAAWAGPWPIDERWWDAETHRRQARFQIVTSDGVARMLTLEGGQWWVTAVWD